MSAFAPTHKLIAPAGEEIPVMLVSQGESHRYRAIAEEEYLEGSSGVYEWHPSEGVSYRGFPLPGLEILALMERQDWQDWSIQSYRMG